MGCIPKGHPFSHENSRAKKRRLQNVGRHRQEQAVLDSLIRGDHQPPTIPNQDQLEQSTTNNDSEWEDNHEPLNILLTTTQTANQRAT